MTELEHVVSKRDDDAANATSNQLCSRPTLRVISRSQLGCLGLRLDIVGNDRDVTEVQSRIDLVHEVQRRWLWGLT